MDRNPQGDPVSFRTPSRERIYEYNALTNQPNFTDGGQTWSQGVNPITPFSTWRLSLPDVALNENIKFGEVTVTVLLRFTFVARITDAFKPSGIPRVRVMEIAGDVQQAPALQDILTSMANRSAVNGWDVVFNMTLSKIQAALNQQYDTLKTKLAYGGKINATSSTQETSHIKIWKKFDLQYGYPKLAFQTNDTTNVSLNIPILSGSLTNGSQIDTDPVDWDPPVSVDPNASIAAVVHMGKLAGLVTPGTGDPNKVFSVVLDLAKGTFVPNNMEVDNDDDKAAFNVALIAYFTKSGEIHHQYPRPQQDHHVG